MIVTAKISLEMFLMNSCVKLIFRIGKFGKGFWVAGLPSKYIDPKGFTEV